MNLNSQPNDHFKIPQRVRLRETKRLGMQQEINLLTGIVGIGSGGVRASGWLYRLILDEFGRLPSSLAFLGFDAAKRDELPNRHLTQAGDGSEDGSGCNPDFASHLLPQYREQLKKALEGFFGTLVHNTASGLSTETIRIVVILTCGGHSTICLQTFLEVIYSVATEYRIHNLRIEFVVPGPGVTVHADDRQLESYQKPIIVANYGLTVGRLLRRIAVHRNGDREYVYSLSSFNQFNGYVPLTGTEEFEKHLATCLYLRYFTPAGSYLAERDTDKRGAGRFHGLPGLHLGQAMNSKAVDPDQEMDPLSPRNVVTSPDRNGSRQYPK